MVMTMETSSVAGFMEEPESGSIEAAGQMNILLPSSVKMTASSTQTAVEAPGHEVGLSVADTVARVYREKWVTATLHVILPAAMATAELVSLVHTVFSTGAQSPAESLEAPTKCRSCTSVTPVGSGMVMVTGTEKFTDGSNLTMDALGLKSVVFIAAGRSSDLTSATVKLVSAAMAPGGKVAPMLLEVFTVSVLVLSITLAAVARSLSSIRRTMSCFRSA
mmetsp:Transcript_27507/g.67611  ORF Transcript_27507/g.67611 Transcript_27507/m.67611 type:complete len:220 (+) Transcript_27507:5826-6485(+)